MSWPRIFLLSPAHCGGKRAAVLTRAEAKFDLAQRFRSPEGATLGEVFAFLSGLYFRGKLAYAERFSHPPFPLEGSLGLLYGLSAAFIAVSLAIGLVFSTAARTQQQAMQMSFFFLLPNILLSGFMFPYEGMPRPAQLLAEALPLTHFLRIVRTITLKGGAFPDVRLELTWLAAILGVLIALASLRFRKKLA